MNTPIALLFVYGSLKEGFPNFHVNHGRRVPGAYRTSQPHPLFLADGRLPCLLFSPGVGHKVAGQLFEVTAADLAAMDALERVGEAGGYKRITVQVEPVGPGSMPGPVDAWAYVQDASRLTAAGTHIGPLSEYTHEHAKSLHW